MPHRHSYFLGMLHPNLFVQGHRRDVAATELPLFPNKPKFTQGMGLVMARSSSGVLVWNDSCRQGLLWVVVR